MANIRVNPSIWPVTGVACATPAPVQLAGYPGRYVSRNRVMARTVDIWSKGEVARYVGDLARTGRVKACEHLKLVRAYANTWRAHCDLDWASRIPANNVDLDVTGYNGPSSYDWPGCPTDCPHLKPTSDFMTSMLSNRRKPDEAVNSHPRRDPLSPDQPESTVAPCTTCGELSPPEKVTLPWLFRHVPVNLWLAALSLLAAAFAAGVHASRFPIVRELFGLGQAPASVQEPEKPVEAPRTRGQNS